ncbi:hypothetical protein QTN25_000674 [Entamoeba marina]
MQDSTSKFDSNSQSSCLPTKAALDDITSSVQESLNECCQLHNNITVSENKAKLLFEQLQEIQTNLMQQHNNDTC